MLTDKSTTGIQHISPGPNKQEVLEVWELYDYYEVHVDYRLPVTVRALK